MKVAILPTGRTEWHGLAPALQRLFPSVEFYAVPTREEVTSYGLDYPYNGFTSSQLTENALTKPPESAMALVARAAQTALGDKHSTAADLVVIVDDVELPNMHQIPRVAGVMRKAVETHLDAIPNAGVRSRTAAALREKVSFHLAAPMVEAWFFADPNALTLAGVPVGANPVFSASTDPEDFDTSDASYAAATESACPVWCTKRGKKDRPKWLGSQDRRKHPKGYLQWLCIAPAQKSCTSYSESTGGATALGNLDWNAVATRPAAHFSLLKALIEDLADGLSCPPCVSIAAQALPAPTSRHGVPMNPVLRNL
ncbi:MAG: hypothetical protein IV100_13280 [Myxococcales bacterium]|nr:hypothetical protein [Myxococcales bacterium]